MEIDVGAAYRGVVSALNASAALWGDRVYADIVPAKIVRPYVLFFVSGGATVLNDVRVSSLLRISVKCVADDLTTALRGAGDIHDRLHDAEKRGGMNTGTDWRLLSVTSETVIQMAELIDGARVYHSGHVYRINLGGVDDGGAC